MPRSFQFCSALCASALAPAAHAHAHEVRVPAANKGGPPKTIKIKARTNPGDLPYG